MVYRKRRVSRLYHIQMRRKTRYELFILNLVHRSLSTVESQRDWDRDTMYGISSNWERNTFIVLLLLLLLLLLLRLLEARGFLREEP